MEQKIILKVACLLPYRKNVAPAQRFRWEQWEKFLNNDKCKFKIIYFSNKKIEYCFKKKKFFLLFFFYILNFFIYFYKIIKNLNSDYFIIGRNAILPGLPIFETFLYLINKKLIYDFDDAIYLSPVNDNFFINILRFKWRVRYIAKLSKMIFIGNRFLEDYIKKYNRNTYIIPTTVDINNYNSKLETHSSKVIVGWTGSKSTSNYIQEIIPVLEKVNQKIPFDIIVLGAKIDLGSLSGKCVIWNSKNEEKFIRKMDIGLMPLPDNKWTKGKCGLKAIQYSNYFIPSIVSDVGVNEEVIINDQTGYVIQNNEELADKLINLIKNKKLRIEMGIKANHHVKKNYNSEYVASKIMFKLKEII